MANTSSRDMVAIGIGDQTSQDVTNTFVSGATACIATVADATGATGVYLRPEDVTFSFSRNESDPENFGSTFNQMPGSLYSIEPTLSFTLPLRGGLHTDTPALDAARASIFAACGLQTVTPDASNPSLFVDYGLSDRDVTYQTVKVWRGTYNSTAAGESWVLTGCFFNVSMSFTAMEQATIQVDVFSSGITHNYNDSQATFPSSLDFQEYSVPQPLDYTPTLVNAGASIGIQASRPLTSGSISITNQTETAGDSNAPNGTITAPSGRTVEFTGDFITDYAGTASDIAGIDYRYLESNGTATTDMPQIFFNLGEAWDQAGAGVANALSFTIDAARITDVAKADFSGGRIINTLSGYAATRGTSSDVPFTIRAR